jgi:hypothetical protein
MNDHDLEVRLSGFYRAEVDGATTAPLTLRMAVADIPVQATRSGRTARRPVLLLAAAMTVVGVGGTLALGAALVRAPERSPDPSTHFGITAPTPGASLIAGPTSGPVASPLVPTDGPEFEPGFRSIGNLATPRFQHTATLLLDGRVLIAGGTSSRGEHLASTEFWDPSTEAFTAGPPLGLGRFGHTATRLDDGRVLIVGGVVAGDPNEIGTREIELWDPATGLFRAAGLTTDPHTGGLTTVRLADGRVMIIGGLDCRPATEPARLDTRPPCRGAQPAAEIWDPVTESVTPTGSPAEDHDWAAATLLADGRVFLLGGGKLPTIGSEVWDPATGGWSPGGAPAQPRLGSQSMTLLPDGRVLVVGGNTGSLNGDPFPPPLRSAEIWDPVTESFSPTGPLEVGRERHRAILLADGRVLILGGVGKRAAAFTDTSIAEAEIWDPASGSFSSAGADAVGRALQTATLLPDGRVLITGGFTRVERGEVAADTATAEIWAP